MTPVDASAPRTRVWRDGVLEKENFSVEQVSDYLKDPDTTVWVDLCQPTDAELDQLAQELGFHELAVEDALASHGRPSVDFYRGHLFLKSFAVQADRTVGQLETIEIDAFASRQWLVTVRENDRFPMDQVVRQWDRSPRLARHGVDFLLYALVDVIVDGYFGALSVFDDYYDAVSEGLFEEHPLDPAQQKHWFDMRRSLVQFHRLVVPMREAISALMRRDHEPLHDDMHVYYQDVYDHILRVIESTDTVRDLINTIVETNLGLREYRQNVIVKKVSGWAAIIAVPAFLTGYFGMNVPYPGSGTTTGVIVSTALIVCLSGVLYWLFRRHDWL